MNITSTLKTIKYWLEKLQRTQISGEKRCAHGSETMQSQPKLQKALVYETDKLLLKFVWKDRGSQRSKTTLKKNRFIDT